MPSVSKTTCLEAVPTLCPHATNLIDANITQGQKFYSVDGDAVTVTSDNRCSINEEQDCLKV